MARAHLTLLILHPVKLIRADFGRSSPPKLLNLWQQNRPDVDDPELLVDVAAAPGGKLGRKVWLLSGDLFAQTVRLDAKSMQLSGDELTAALAFEAEPLSGISGLEAAIGYQHLHSENGEREFSVVSARRDDIVLLRDAVGSRRGELVGVASMSSVPEEGDPFSDEQRLRVWLTQTAQLLLVKSVDLPVLLPPKVPLTQKQRGLISAALALAAVLLCWAHYSLATQPAINRLFEEKKKHEAEDKKFKDKEKAEADQRAGIQETKKQIDMTKKSVEAASLQRDRLGVFLAHVAEECDALKKRKHEMLITKIDFPGGEPRLRGFVLQAHVASDFADQLGPAAARLGWHLDAPKAGAKYVLNSGAPWEFEIRFKDVLSVPELPRKAQGKRPSPPPSSK